MAPIRAHLARPGSAAACLTASPPAAGFGAAGDGRTGGNASATGLAARDLAAAPPVAAARIGNEYSLPGGTALEHERAYEVGCAKERSQRLVVAGEGP